MSSFDGMRKYIDAQHTPWYIKIQLLLQKPYAIDEFGVTYKVAQQVIRNGYKIYIRKVVYFGY